MILPRLRICSLLLCSVLSATPAFCAVGSPIVPDTGATQKGKTVKVILKNATLSPMTLSIRPASADVDTSSVTTITVQPNALYALAAPEGTQIFGEDGVRRLLVTRDVSGATVIFH